MKRTKLCLFLPILLLPLLLSACGGGGAGDSLVSTDSGIKSGIVVDPYIVGAYLEEVSPDSQNIIQRTTLNASSNFGFFQFENAIGDGSIIRIKRSDAVTHAGASYSGVLKRQVFEGDTGPVVVSPLTTLLANGMTEADVIQMMSSAGFTGITESNLYDDHMGPLINKTGMITDAELVLLQANMAVNVFMEATNNFNYHEGVSTAAVQTVTFAECAEVIKSALNRVIYQDLASSLGADFTVGDMANTAVRISSTVVQGITSTDTTISQLTENALADKETVAAGFYQARKGTTDPGTTDPGTVADINNGQDIFSSACSDCHSNGTSTSVMNLANDGGKVATKFAGSGRHNGSTLTALEIADVAAYLDNQGGGVTPTPDPGTGTGTSPTGSELYATECQGCHGNLQTSDIIDRTAAGISSAITSVTDMNGLILNAEEIQLISDALATEPPPVIAPPAVERTGQQVFDQECTACHALGTHDTSGIELAGLGATIVPKIQASHQNKDQAMTPAELTALASYADTFTPPVIAPPAVERTGQQVFDQECTACHALGTHDTSGIELAGLGATIVPKIQASHQNKDQAMTPAELTALASYADTFTPPVIAPPAVERTGQQVFDQECTACHALGTHDTSGIELAGLGATIVPKIQASHQNKDQAMTPAELTALASYADTFTPPVIAPPAVERTGQQVFDQECTACHALGTHDTSGIELAGLGATIVPKIQASHQNKDQAMTPAELTALASYADTFTPPVIAPPAVERTGQQVFDQECTACHALGTHDTSGIELAGLGATIVPKIQASHQNKDQAMTPAELTALATFADTFTASTGGGTGGACDSCHGQPPAGNTSPNTAGAHAVHTALTGVGNDCDSCHTGATHNDWVDLGFPAKWDAESGIARDNLDGTCSSIICHGGQQTPDWTTGSINVNTQCQSCHVSGSSQYNGYASGEHGKHVRSERIDCIVCHDVTKLQSGHFGDLSTPVFEKDPAATLKSFLNYNNGGCNPSGCHGSEDWEDR